MGEDLKIILSEIQTLRAGGCLIGAENKTKLDRIERDYSQHDKRICRVENKSTGLEKSLDTMPEQVATVVAEQIADLPAAKPTRTMIPIPMGGKVYPIPATWFAWAVVGFGMWFIWSSHHNGMEATTIKLNEGLEQMQKIQTSVKKYTDGVAYKEPSHETPENN